MKTTLRATLWLSLIALCVAPAAGQKGTNSQGAEPEATGGSAPRISARAVERQPASPDLAAAIRSLAKERGGPFWLGYEVPAVDRKGTICCFDSVARMKNGRCGHCRLEEENGFSINMFDDEDKIDLEAEDELLVLARIANGKVGRVRVFSQDCEVDAGKLSFVTLTGVDDGQSLEWLASLLDGANEDAREEIITAIALHRNPAADKQLERLVRPQQPEETREHAAFWIGQARGTAGIPVLKRLARTDASEEMRKKAIFALSQSDVPEALNIMIEAAHEDQSGDVRGEALFWLAEKAGQKAMEAIAGALESDPDVDVKKKAVFALSQLPVDEGVPLLIDVARKNKSREVRKEAIFWLGQSEDPRALAFIEGILKS